MTRVSLLSSSLFVFLFCCIQSLNAQVIWTESFDTTNGVPNDAGVTAWSIENTGCATIDRFEVRNSVFEARDTDCEAIWRSEWIDISSFGTVSISRST